ncbi:MAG TPA: GAF domain-containing protein [Terriglobales bacterium]|nr:GAF domain-containing protein [Terriglobales bacterium]
MATQGQAFASPLSFAAGLLQEREVIPRARIAARAFAEHLPGCAIILYTSTDIHSKVMWVAKAIVGEITMQERTVDPEIGTLGIVMLEKEPMVFSGAGLRREEFAHLNIRRTLSALAYVPILHKERLLGVVEIVSYDRVLEVSDLDQVMGLMPFVSTAIAAAISYEDERNSDMESISRLTQLYDLERVFNSTIQMNQLLPIITQKVQEITRVQACNLWMVQGEELLLINRSGDDATLEVGTSYATGQSIPTEALDTNKSILITKQEDPRLIKRNGDLGDGGIHSVLAMPIITQGYKVGVVEVVNKLDGKPFSEDDFYFLGAIVPTVANALRNASLLEAEKKIEILETLVEVSREITSSLNLDRILQLVVNGPQKIMTYDRAAVALEQSGKVQLRAISGKSEVNMSDPHVKRLRSILEWAMTAEAETFVVQHGTELSSEREEERLKFQEYFQQSGLRAFYAVPLQDEQGRLGVLSFESRSPDFLSETHFELIKVLASQATVALRNASLYTEVPFIGILEPLLQKRNEFMRMEGRRRTAIIFLAVAAVLFLAVFPLPMRVVGDSIVAAETTSKVQAAVEGVVKNVYVREGDVVKPGTILADLEDWEFRSALAAAQARHASAMAEANRALANKDGTEAGIKRLEADYWASEVKRAHERLELTHLRSTQDGVVATPRLEQAVGQKLETGDLLATVVSTSRAQVDVAIDETDVPLLEAGETVAIKLESFPTRKFSGTVILVSPVSTPEADRRVFHARVSVPNTEGLMRPGMQGRSKITTGWKPAGYVLFRGAAMWTWSKMWTWFGW